MLLTSKWVTHKRDVLPVSYNKSWAVCPIFTDSDRMDVARNLIVADNILQRDVWDVYEQEESNLRSRRQG